MNRTAISKAANTPHAWKTRREALRSLSACWQTQPPSSSTPQGVMTNSWGGCLFSNPNGNRDVQTVCYYLLCSWSEPRYLTTHSPSVSHSHFSLPIGPLSHLIGLRDSLVRHLKPPMVIEGTLDFRSYSSDCKCLNVPLEEVHSVNGRIRLVELEQGRRFSLLGLMFKW